MTSLLRPESQRRRFAGKAVFGFLAWLALVAGYRARELPGQSVPHRDFEGVVASSPRTAIVVPETVFIRGGTFVMGTPIRNKYHREYHADEAPLTVTIRSFWIGKTPVTASQFCAFLNSEDGKMYKREELYWHGPIGPYRYSTILLSDAEYAPYPGAENSCANQVTWRGAALYCEWLYRITGSKYRLPTEAEWEYAARGEEGRLWPWGNEPPDETRGYRRVGTFDEADPWQNRQTSPVGSFPAGATPDGVMDMLGHLIGEWCVSKYRKQPTPADVNDPTADLDDLESHRVVRGYYHRRFSRGGWLSYQLRGSTHPGKVWTRYNDHPIQAPRTAARYGFRIVLQAKTGPDEKGRGQTTRPAR